MSKLQELKAESTTAYQKRKELETRIYALKNELGAIIIEKGWNSSEYKEAARKLRNTEDTLGEIKTLQEALNKAIKIGEKWERQTIDAETFKKNQQIIEKYTKSLPKCERCGSNEFVKLVSVEPRNYDSPVNTQPIEMIWFECRHGAEVGGLRFSIHRSEMQGITEKIGNAIRKLSPK